MSRWISSVATLVIVVLATASADAQVFYQYPYGAPVYAPAPVVAYPTPVFAAPVVTAYAPAYMAPQPIAQMAYTAPAVVAAPVVAPAPVAVAAPSRTFTRVGPHNSTQVTRVYGPAYGPHYARVHVHNGIHGTTVRERIR